MGTVCCKSSSGDAWPLLNGDNAGASGFGENGSSWFPAAHASETSNQSTMLGGGGSSIPPSRTHRPGSSRRSSCSLPDVLPAVSSRQDGPHTATPSSCVRCRAALHDRIMRSLQQPGMRVADLVKLPEGEDRNEWIAVHCVDFFNEVDTPWTRVGAGERRRAGSRDSPHPIPAPSAAHAPVRNGVFNVHARVVPRARRRARAAAAAHPGRQVMSAGPKYTYLWADGVTVVNPTRVPARDCACVPGDGGSPTR